MGGGGPYPYPKWVWSPLGGAHALPKSQVRNAIFTSGLIFAITMAAGYWSAKHETRHSYPNRWIPSMLWARDFHDPAFVAMWKEQLKLEGREWIEPIPDWWPFK